MMVISAAERRRWGLTLARFLLLTFCWFVAAIAAAQDLGDPQHFELRRLPPVEAVFDRHPVESVVGNSLDLVTYESQPPPPVELGINDPRFHSDVGNSLEVLPPPYVDTPLDASLQTPELVEPMPLDQKVEVACPLSDLPYEPFGRPYNYTGSGAPGQSGWIVGNGDRMGIFSLAINYPDWWCVGRNRIQVNPAVHFVSGPTQADMPSRLYDLDVGFVRRDTIASPVLAYEVAFRVGYFSDFQGSAREGLRFPAHAVFFYQASESRQFVLGVDYLDRDDIPVLPVVGMSFSPYPKLWLEAVFPKPRIAVQIGPHRWWYVAAEMGGGRWAIERAWLENDVVNYRDYRILLGVQQDHTEGFLAFLELGFVFNRKLEYRSRIGDYRPQNTGFVRSVIRY